MKKLFKSLFLFLLLCMPCLVLAEGTCLDPEEVIEKIPNGYFMQIFNADGETVSMTNDKVNKVLTFSEVGADEIMSINYDDCHFTFSNDTDPGFFASFAQTLIFAGLQSAIFETAGHSNYTLGIDEPTEVNSEVYGISLETEEVVIDDESGHVEYDFIKSFDIELDKTKVEKLFADFGEYIMPDVAPRLEGKSATDKTIDIQLSLPGDYEAEYYECELYISKDAGTTYTKYITTRCDSKVTVQGLEPGKKYLFKSNIVDDEYESDAIELSTTVTPGSGKENPNTGSNISVFIVPALLLVGLLGIAFSNNKKAFKDLK